MVTNAAGISYSAISSRIPISSMRHPSIRKIHHLAERFCRALMAMAMVGWLLSGAGSMEVGAPRMTAGHDDTSVTLDAWHQLHSPRTRDLLLAVEAIETPGPSELGRLRREWPAPVVSAALELSRARRKARAKFEHASELWCDVPGVEQASSEQVAGWKAGRFREAGAESVLDLCCGIGGDTRSLAAVAAVHAIDLDPDSLLDGRAERGVHHRGRGRRRGRGRGPVPARRSRSAGRAKRAAPLEPRGPSPAVVGARRDACPRARRSLQAGPRAAASPGRRAGRNRVRGDPGTWPAGPGRALVRCTGRDPGRRRATLLPEAATVCGNPDRIVAPARPRSPASTWSRPPPPSNAPNWSPTCSRTVTTWGSSRPAWASSVRRRPSTPRGSPAGWSRRSFPCANGRFADGCQDHDTGEVVVRTRGACGPGR